MRMHVAYMFCLACGCSGSSSESRDLKRRAEDWCLKNEYDRAIKNLNGAIRLNPRDADAFAKRGDAWFKKNDYDQAIVDYDKAIQLGLRDSLIYNNRGLALYNQKLNGKAIADYDEAIRLDPQNVLAYANRANAHHRNKDYDKAIEDGNEAIRLAPRYYPAFVNRGLVWWHKKEYQKAVADFSKAVQLNPSDFAAYAGRARLWATCANADCRDGKRAIESARRACELTGWKVANTIEILAMAYAEVGDFDNAVRYQERALPMEAKRFRSIARKQLETYRAGKPWRED